MAFLENMNFKGKYAQGSTLALIFGDLSQIEKLSEIKPPLAPLSFSRSLSEEELFKFSTDLDMASFKRKLDPP